MTLGRLWLRGTWRRPGRIAIVAAGLLAMTVTTTAAMVAADALDRLFVADARARWGAIDVEVARADRGVFGEGLAAEVTLQSVPAFAAATPRLILDGVARHGTRAERDLRVVGITAGDRTVGPLPRLQGRVDPASLASDEVVVNARLASRLQVAVGDEIALVLAVPEVTERDANGLQTERRPATAAAWNARVAGIARNAGAADLGRTANAFARLGPLQRAASLTGKVSAIHARAPLVGDATDDLVDAFDEAGGRFGLAASPVKDEALVVAEDEGGVFRALVLSLAAVVAAASLVLTAHLVGLLAIERAHELAVLRAVGVRARRLTAMVTAEGLVCAVIAAAGGAALGLPTGAAIADRLARHVARLESSRGHEQVPLQVGARPVVIALAVAVTLLVAGAAIWATARRAVDVDVDARLRDRGDPPAPRPAGRVVASGAGFLALGAGLAGGVPALLFAGVFLLGVAGWQGVRRARPERTPRFDDLAAIAGATWCIGGPALLGTGDAGVRSTFALLTLAGAGAVACATLLLTARLRPVVRFVRAYLPAGRTQAALRTAGGWAEADRARTGAVAGTVGGVLFMVAALAVLGRATAIPVDRQDGGFDVIAETVAELSPEDAAGLAATDQTVASPFARLAEGSWGVEGVSVPYPVRAVRASTTLAVIQQWKLADGLPGVRDAADALRRVAGSRTQVVLDRYARPDGARPGDDVELDTGFGPQRFELIAVLDTYLLQGVLLGADPYDRLFARRGATLVLAAADPGTSPRALARQLERTGASRGLTADTVEQAAADVTRANRAFTDIFGILLLVGLAVAVLGAAASYARAGRSRWRDLGVLRAVGLRRRHVTLALLTEPVVAGVAGVVVGVGVGLGTLGLLFAVALDDLAFVIDVPLLAVASLATVVLLALATAVPALLAAGVDPDRAVRSPE